MIFHLNEEMNQKVHKNMKKNSSNSLVFSRWPQTKSAEMFQFFSSKPNFFFNLASVRFREKERVRTPRWRKECSNPAGSGVGGGGGSGPREGVSQLSPFSEFPLSLIRAEQRVQEKQLIHFFGNAEMGFSLDGK